MDITPPLVPGVNYINGYSERGFKVNGQLVSSHIILSPTEMYIWNIEENIFALNNYYPFIENFSKKNKGNSVILIGTGTYSEPPSLELLTLFNEHNISPEVMSTPAACRTYNVLISEQRDIHALLQCVKIQGKV